MVSHIQVFALSRWLAVTLPVEYYEFARSLQWSIPYFNLPWEKPQAQSYFEGSNLPANPHPFASKIYDSGIPEHVVRGEQTFVEAATAYGLPLTPMEYRTFFEVRSMKVMLSVVLALQFDIQLQCGLFCKTGRKYSSRSSVYFGSSKFTWVSFLKKKTKKKPHIFSVKSSIKKKTFL